MAKAGRQLLHGTLELLVLKLLDRGPMNGYAIGQTIRRVTDDGLVVDEGSLYPALYRMERRGLLSSRWARSENNRRAKYYRLTRAGRRQLGVEADAWNDFSDAIEKILESA